MFETAISTLLWKLGFYFNQIKTFSAYNIPFQVVLAFCPTIFHYLTGNGWVIFMAVMGLSVLHYRLFHIFFVLVLLKADLPSEIDKSFWRAIFIFSAIVFLWGYLGFLSMMNWTTLASLNGG